ncbi:MAG: hypothetical protein ACLT4D_14440 [Blautia faecis]
MEAQQKEKNRKRLQGQKKRRVNDSRRTTVSGRMPKVLKEEQMDAVSMGLDFGLPVSDIQKVVKSNQKPR